MLVTCRYCEHRQGKRSGVLGESLPDLRQPGMVRRVRVGPGRRDGCHTQAGRVRTAHPAAVFQPLESAELRETGALRERGFCLVFRHCFLCVGWLEPTWHHYIALALALSAWSYHVRCRNVIIDCACHVTSAASSCFPCRVK